MINRINSAMRKSLGIEIRRSGQVSKTRPLPLVEFNAQRLMYFYDLLRRVDGVDGDIVECGVKWGRSLFSLIAACRWLGSNRRFIGYDAFSNYPRPAPEDEPDTHRYDNPGHAASGAPARQHLLNSGIDRAFVDANVNIVEGPFPRTLPGYDGNAIALLHLDCDMYVEHAQAMRQLYPKVPECGVIVFDEYQKNSRFPGARKAIDEYLDGREVIQSSDVTDHYHIFKAGEAGPGPGGLSRPDAEQDVHGREFSAR